MKPFIPYELAVTAKAKGFNQVCWALSTYREVFLLNISDEDSLAGQQDVSMYNNVPCIATPMYQQIVDWFRNTHGINVEAWSIWDKTITPNAMGYMPSINSTDRSYEDPFDADCICVDYYGALNYAITEALKLI